MMNLAVLASGNGSNFEAIARAVKKGRIKALLKVVLTDNEKAFVRTRAKKFGVKDVFINPEDYNSRAAYDKALVKALKKEKIDLVILAGYMRILTPYFVRGFRDRIINIHPAILPAFKGTDSIKRAMHYGVKITGVTIHFVDDKVDHGPIIMQESIKITESMTLKELEIRIHKLEHKLYPLAVKLVTEGKVKRYQRHVKII